MKPVEENAASLQKHMAQTYHNLRIGIAVIGIALPVLLWIGGLVAGPGRLLSSMSAYYYTPMRDVFVGALVAIGAFLYLYKGFSRKENWALNAAGLFAATVAFVATSDPEKDSAQGFEVHDAAAVAFFLCIAYVAVFRASDTLALIGDAKREANLRRTYRTLGVLMVASPVAAFVLSYALDPGSRGRSAIFFAEMAGVWVFAAYWLFKSWEISQTGAEQLALEAKIETKSDPGAPRCLARV